MLATILCVCLWSANIWIIEKNFKLSVGCVVAIVVVVHLHRNWIEMKIYAQSELIAQYISGMAVTLVCQQCGQTAVVVVAVAVNGFDTLAWCEQNMRSLLWFITLFIFGACLIMYTKCSNAFTITTKARTTTTTAAREANRNNNNCSSST